jgi:hypothetical protein
MIDRICGENSAAPRPCAILPAIRTAGLAAAPQTAEARVKSASPIMSARRRPIRSPSRPPTVSPDARACESVMAVSLAGDGLASITREVK